MFLSIFFDILSFAHLSLRFLKKSRASFTVLLLASQISIPFIKTVKLSLFSLFQEQTGQSTSVTKSISLFSSKVADSKNLLLRVFKTHSNFELYVFVTP